MTEPNKTAADAQAKLYHEVYAPTFFNKLASYGIRPTNEAQAQSLLRQGAKLRAAYEQDAVKTAAAQGDFLLMAEQRLDASLAKHASVVNQPTAEDREIAAYAQKLASERPDLRDAAIAIQSEAARQLQQQAA